MSRSVGASIDYEFLVIDLFFVPFVAGKKRGFANLSVGTSDLWHYDPCEEKVSRVSGRQPGENKKRAALEAIEGARARWKG